MQATTTTNNNDRVARLIYNRLIDDLSAFEKTINKIEKEIIDKQNEMTAVGLPNNLCKKDIPNDKKFNTDAKVDDKANDMHDLLMKLLKNLTYINVIINTVKDYSFSDDHDKEDSQSITINDHQKKALKLISPDYKHGYDNTINPQFEISDINHESNLKNNLHLRHQFFDAKINKLIEISFRNNIENINTEQQKDSWLIAIDVCTILLMFRKLIISSHEIKVEEDLYLNKIEEILLQSFIVYQCLNALSVGLKNENKTKIALKKKELENSLKELKNNILSISAKADTNIHNQGQINSDNILNMTKLLSLNENHKADDNAQKESFLDQDLEQSNMDDINDFSIQIIKNLVQIDAQFIQNNLQGMQKNSETYLSTLQTKFGSKQYLFENLQETLKNSVEIINQYKDQICHIGTIESEQLENIDSQSQSYNADYYSQNAHYIDKYENELQEDKSDKYDVTKSLGGEQNPGKYYIKKTFDEEQTRGSKIKKDKLGQYDATKFLEDEQARDKYKTKKSFAEEEQTRSSKIKKDKLGQYDATKFLEEEQARGKYKTKKSFVEEEQTRGSKIKKDKLGQYDATKFLEDEQARGKYKTKKSFAEEEQTRSSKIKKDKLGQYDATEDFAEEEQARGEYDAKKTFEDEEQNPNSKIKAGASGEYGHQKAFENEEAYIDEIQKKNTTFLQTHQARYTTEIRSEHPKIENFREIFEKHNQCYKQFFDFLREKHKDKIKTKKYHYKECQYETTNEQVIYKIVDQLFLYEIGELCCLSSFSHALLIYSLEIIHHDVFLVKSFEEKKAISHKQTKKYAQEIKQIAIAYFLDLDVKKILQCSAIGAVNILYEAVKTHITKLMQTLKKCYIKANLIFYTNPFPNGKCYDTCVEWCKIIRNNTFSAIKYLAAELHKCPHNPLKKDFLTDILQLDILVSVPRQPHLYIEFALPLVSLLHSNCSTYNAEIIANIEIVKHITLFLDQKKIPKEKLDFIKSQISEHIQHVEFCQDEVSTNKKDDMYELYGISIFKLYIYKHSFGFQYYQNRQIKKLTTEIAKSQYGPYIQTTEDKNSVEIVIDASLSIDSELQYSADINHTKSKIDEIITRCPKLNHLKKHLFSLLDAADQIHRSERSNSKKFKNLNNALDVLFGFCSTKFNTNKTPKDLGEFMYSVLALSELFYIETMAKNHKTTNIEFIYVHSMLTEYKHEEKPITTDQIKKIIEDFFTENIGYKYTDSDIDMLKNVILSLKNIDIKHNNNTEKATKHHIKYVLGQYFLYMQTKVLFYSQNPKPATVADCTILNVFNLNLNCLSEQINKNTSDRMHDGNNHRQDGCNEFLDHHDSQKLSSIAKEILSFISNIHQKFIDYNKNKTEDFKKNIETELDNEYNEFTRLKKKAFNTLCIDLQPIFDEIESVAKKMLNAREFMLNSMQIPPDSKTTEISVMAVDSDNASRCCCS